MSTQLTNSNSFSKSSQQIDKSPHVAAIRYQALKLRRAELEKKLNEKYNSLQQICREEAQLIGVYPSDFCATGCEPGSSVPTLRRKVGTSFKLPENLLNKEDDINKLILEKQIQTQITEASLRLANDSTQTKSIRRTHKQNYESAQHKLMVINQNLNVLKRQQQISQDDINLHKSASKQVKSPASNTLNCNTSIMYMERRNSMKSTTSSLGSNNTFIVQSGPSSATSTASLKVPALVAPRTRHESYSNGSHLEYESQPSPTFSNGYERGNPPQPSQQHSVNQYQYKNKSRIEPSHQYMHYHQPGYNTMPFEQTATVPTDKQFLNRLHSFNHHYSQQLQLQQLSPNAQAFCASDMLLATYQDELKENGNMEMIQNLQQQVKYQKMQQGFHVQSQPQGLGGYWTINDLNERVWCNNNSENKFSTVDRKNQIYRLKSTSSPNIQLTTKSTSISNFDLSSNDFVAPDALSISSGTSNETKKKEKIWRETSLDGPAAVSKTKLVSTKLPISTSSLSLSPKFYGANINSNQLDNTSNNNIQYGSPTSSRSFRHNHQQLPPSNFQRPVSPTLSTQQQDQYHLQNLLQLQQKRHHEVHQPGRSSVISQREEDLLIYNNFPPSHAKPPLSEVRAAEEYSHYANVSPPPPIIPQHNHQRNTTYFPNLPPKSKLKHSESTRSTTSHLHVDLSSCNQISYLSPTLTQSPSMQMLKSPDIIQTESPKNMTVVQEGKIQPYKEICKPFEMSDFYKYSTKFRQNQTTNNTLQRQEQPNEQINNHYQSICEP